MKTAILLVPSLCLFATAAGDLDYAPREGTVVTRSFVSSGRYTLEDVAVEVDGNAMDQEVPDMSITSKETIRVTDVLGKVADGRPLQLERTFDELVRDVTYDFDGESRPERSTSDFEGVTVRFAFDADEDEYEVEVEVGDDEDVSQDYLDELVEDMDFRGVLPGEEVEEGDSWELDPAVYLTIMSPAGALNFYSEEEGEVDEDAREADLEMMRSIDGEATAELVELREDDGGRVAVIRLEFDVASKATVEFETPDGVEGVRTMEVGRVAEGQLVWDLERAMARSLRMRADATLTVTMSFEPEDDEGNPHTIRNEQTFEGSIEYEVDFEVE